MSSPHEDNGNRYDHNSQQHPILDVKAEDVEPLDKHVQGRFPRLEDANQNLYFYFQIKVPQLFPLDASNRMVRILLLCRTILDHMNGELPTRAHKHSNAFNRFASRPKTEFTQAFSCQILPRNSHIPHGTQDLVR